MVLLIQRKDGPSPAWDWLPQFSEIQVGFLGLFVSLFYFLLSFLLIVSLVIDLYIPVTSNCNNGDDDDDDKIMITMTIYDDGDDK